MSNNTQKTYPQFEQWKNAVYVIMYALFNDVFDMGGEMGDFREEIAEYMEENRMGYWINYNLLVTDRFLDWMFEVFPYFYAALLTRPAFVNYLFKTMYESERDNDKTMLHSFNPAFMERYFEVGKDGVREVDFYKYNEGLYQFFLDKIQNRMQILEPMEATLSMCSGTMSEPLKNMLRYIAGHFLELLFLLMHDNEVYVKVLFTLKNVEAEMRSLYGMTEKE